MFIKAVAVHLLHVEGLPGQGQRYWIVVRIWPTRMVAAHPGQPTVGDAWRTPTPLGDLARGFVEHRQAELLGIHRHDGGEFVLGVELEVLLHLEAVAHRAGQHAAAGGRTDEREPLEVHADGSGVHAVAQHDVDAEVFHGRVDELFHDARHAVDLVDEQHAALFEVREEWQQVRRFGQCRAAGELHRGAHLVGQHRGEGGLAQTRRPIEQDVPQRFAHLLGTVHGNLQPLAYFHLPDDFTQQFRA